MYMFIESLVGLKRLSFQALAGNKLPIRLDLFTATANSSSIMKSRSLDSTELFTAASIRCFDLNDSHPLKI